MDIRALREFVKQQADDLANVADHIEAINQSQMERALMRAEAICSGTASVINDALHEWRQP